MRLTHLPFPFRSGTEAVQSAGVRRIRRAGQHGRTAMPTARFRPESRDLQLEERRRISHSACYSRNR